MRLEEYLALWAGRRFDWRSCNCVHYVAGWAAQRGVPDMPVRADIRALVRLRRAAGGVVPAVSRALAVAPVRGPNAGQGDIAGVRMGRDRFALGLVVGPALAVLSPAGGLDYLPLQWATVAWRLP